MNTRKHKIKLQLLYYATIMSKIFQDVRKRYI